MRFDFFRKKQNPILIIGATLLLGVPLFAGAVNINVTTLTIPAVQVVGALSKGSGSFVIDHPLDPKNKLLYHSFVESPDVKNIYDGIATLDKSGEVTVELPAYFEALNKNFRYEFFPIGIAAPGLYIKQGVTDNRFIVAGGPPGAKISWQVTGIRHDPYILANPIVPEVEKTANTIVPKGQYLFPEYEDYAGK